MKIILTGVAGFIGAQTARILLDKGHHVTGLDNLNNYYDPQLKRDRLELLHDKPGFCFIEQDIADHEALVELTKQEAPERFVHLAAQAGVRYSLENPMAYVSANLVGFANVLEACRQQQVPHLVYASSSSVYGNNSKLPFSEHDAADHPLSLYAASKRSNELMAHSYAHLYDLPVTGLRFFTVYGPWGRPDMAPIKFVKAIDEGGCIQVFNHGHHQRDFTYIDDIVNGLVRVICDASAEVDGRTIFDKFDLEAQIHANLERKVWLKSGGSLVVDQSEALTAMLLIPSTILLLTTAGAIPSSSATTVK